MVRSYGKRLLPAVILLGLMSTVGTAQDGGVKKFVNQQPGVDARPTLVLAIRTPRSLSKGDIEATLDVIKKELIAEGKEKLTWDEAKVIPSTRQGFEQVQLIVRGDEKADGGNPNAQVRKATLRLPKNGVFEIDCGDPRYSLDSMSLNYGTNQTEKFVVNPDQKDNPLSYNRTHRTYYFEHDEKKYPEAKDYKLKIIKKEATKTKEAEVEETEVMPWPQERENFWVVKLIGWSGDITQINFENDDRWSFALPDAG